MSKAVANLTQSTETITFSAQDNGETISVNITEAARGPAGAAGAAGPNSVTSATTSDGTANLSLSNVTTATAEVTGTLTANHIHGNLAGSVYAHVRAGEALAKGDPVYVSGSHGTGANLIAVVSKADASDALKMPAVGIMDAAVANNANGHMVITGTITDINTAAYSVNAELYVAEGGGFTATPPNARAQPVARVERSNTNNGALIVKVNGLSAISPTASTLMRRDSASAVDLLSLNIGDLHTGGSPSGSYGTIGRDSLTGLSGVGISGSPALGLEAQGHRMTFSTGGVAISSGTLTTSQPLSLTQTWNASGVTFKGIDVNVTDTASASGSLLMDLRVGGASRFSVSKSGDTATSGRITTSSNTTSTSSPAIHLSAYGVGNPAGITLQSATQMLLCTQGVASFSVGLGALVGSAQAYFGMSNSTSTANQTSDVRLYRDDTGIFAQRNGTNAQESRVYGTYTSATNFERLNLKYNSTALAYQIGTEKGSGGGTARPLEFQTDGTTRAILDTSGCYFVGNNSGLRDSNNSRLIVSNDQVNDNNIIFRTAVNSASQRNVIRLDKSRGTYSSPLAVQNGDNIGSVFSGAFDGSNNQYSAGFGFIVNGSVSAGSVPCDIFFSTGASIGSLTERLRITSSGIISFGGLSSSFPALKRSSTILQARLADDSGYTTIDAQHRLQGSAPASATAAGTVGDIRYDSDYIYICTATNTWKRAAIATWP